MPIQVAIRDYSMPDTDLSAFSELLCSVMTRDLSDLAIFGVTSLAVTNLHSLNIAFEVFPNDDF